jgi:hypothetical protein
VRFWPKTPWLQEAATIAAGGFGAFVLHSLGFPAAVMSGGMLAVAALIALGIRPTLSAPTRDFCMLLCGASMGATVTPEMLKAIAAYPVSLFLFTVSIALTMVLSQVFLVRACRWDKLSAFFASAPGALSSVLAVAADTKADMVGISVVQGVRLFVLVAILPSVVSASGAGAGWIAPQAAMTPPVLALVLLLGFAVALLFERLNVPAAWIFAGMLCSAALHGGGTVEGAVPGALQIVAFLLVGIFVGTRFNGIDGQALARLFRVSIAAFGLGMLSAVLFSWLTARITGVAFGAALLAFAPGGLEAMIVLGAALGLDPLYVSVHHLYRFIGISLLVPVAAAMLRRP